jgi:CheY-like chemotaxis protein
MKPLSEATSLRIREFSYVFAAWIDVGPGDSCDHKWRTSMQPLCVRAEQQLAGHSSSTIQSACSPAGSSIFLTRFHFTSRYQNRSSSCKPKYDFPFTICDALPLSEGPAAGSLFTPLRKTTLSQRSVISIIDDDGSVRAAIYNLVRSFGYTVHAFSSAEEFLRSPELNDTSCAISDVRMPTMSGIELQAHLLAQGHCVPFIFMTAFPVESIRARALKAGAICVLSKPFNGDTLIECLNTALEKRRGG